MIIKIERYTAEKTGKKCEHREICICFTRAVNWKKVKRTYYNPLENAYKQLKERGLWTEADEKRRLEPKIFEREYKTVYGYGTEWTQVYYYEFDKAYIIERVYTTEPQYHYELKEIKR